MKKIILTLLFLSFIFVAKPANAWLPGGAAGKVEAELPDGTRIPLPGVKIFRMDWWTWWYCPPNKRCWGIQDGVETTTDGNGRYTMDNDHNNPGWLCSNERGAKRCPTGRKGEISLCLERASDSCPDNKNKLICANPPLKSWSFNWCGFNCDSNPHRWEAYFPENYHLPGNLENLGYSHLRGSWHPQSYEENFTNDEIKERKNFIFKLSPPLTPTPTPLLTPTSSPMPTPTATPTPSATPTPTTIPTSTPTPSPTLTATPTPPHILTPTPTSEPTPSSSWFQTKEGDVHSNAKIISNLPETDLFFSLTGEGGFPGIVSCFDNNPRFGQGKVSEKNWLVTGFKNKKQYDYSYFNTLLEIPEENVINNSDSFSVLDGDKLNDKTISSNPFWKIEGDLEVRNLNDNLGVKIFLVSGKIIYKNDLEPQNTLPVFIAQGDIEIQPTIHFLNGIFISDGKIKTGEVEENQNLKIKGAAISWNSFLLEREIKNNDEPAEIFIYNPEIFLKIFPFIGKTSHIWEEIAP